MPKSFRRTSRWVIVLSTLPIASAACAQQIQFGQIDDFEDGTVFNWAEGGLTSPNPPTNELGGPAGAGDHYLQDISSGVGTAGSKQIMLNQSQWSGNFLSAHVTRLTADMENLGDTPLYMRVALEGPGVYESTNPVVLDPHSAWQHVTFDLSAAGMTSLGGTLSGTLASVFEMRILSSQLGGTVNGDTIASTLGMDNLRALTLPGDADQDNMVTTADFTVLAAHFGQTGQIWTSGDFNFDGVVNALDFNALASNFGQTVVIDPPPAGALVPEPSAMMICLIAIGMVNRKRKQTFTRL